MKRFSALLMGVFALCLGSCNSNASSPNTHTSHVHVPGTPIEENKVEPTCTQDGSYDLVTYCVEDHEALSREHKTIPALGHDYQRVTIAPTFESDGIVTYTCSRCGENYSEKGENKLEHCYASSWAFNESYHWHACLDDGYGQLKTDDEPHTFIDTVTDPTYNSGGYTTHACTVCGYSYVDNETERLTYNISFDLNEGTSSQLINNQEVHSFDEIVFAIDCVKEGFNFRGWSYNDTKVVDQFGNIISVPPLDGDMTFVAIFVQDVNVIINNTNQIAGSVIGDGYYAYNTYVEIRAIPNDGYSFDGWYYENTLLSKQETYKYMMWDRDVTFEARWTLIEYTIIYNLDGGINSLQNPSTYTVESEIVLSNPSKTGHSFSCWKNGDSVFTKITKGTTGDLVLDAYYDVNSYTISVSSSDESKGTVSGGGEYVYGSQITITATPEEYCQFDGWYLNGVLVSTEESYTFNVPDQNGNCIGMFSLKTYQLHVESRHPLLGSIMIKGDAEYQNLSDKGIKYQESVIVSAYTITQEYEFLGWFDSENNLISPNAVYSFAMPHSDYELYARWNSPSFDLEVSPNDSSKGTVSGSGVYEYNTEITVVATPAEECLFEGWYHGETRVSTNPCYTFTVPLEDYSLVARFLTEAEEEWNENHGVIPVFSDDRETVTYGLYPQTNVNDSALIASLNLLTAPEQNGWYLYEGEYYAKVSAKPTYSNRAQLFDNGDTIVIGTSYWFKCEPIQWKVFDDNNGNCFLLSSYLLDSCPFHNSTSTRIIDGQTVYPNNYKYSDLRAWLNSDFYDSSFALGDSYIQTTTVDNSTYSAWIYDDQYTCENTQDKVFLPSYRDYADGAYGLSDPNIRCCKPTDWAKARGCVPSEYYGYCAPYYLRSPSSDGPDTVQFIEASGSICHILVPDDVDETLFGIRPVISIGIA